MWWNRRTPLCLSYGVTHCLCRRWSHCTTFKLQARKKFVWNVYTWVDLLFQVDCAYEHTLGLWRALIHEHFNGHNCVFFLLFQCVSALWKEDHLTKFKILHCTLLVKHYMCHVVEEKVKWRWGNKAWQAMCFTIQTGLRELLDWPASGCVIYV